MHIDSNNQKAFYGSFEEVFTKALSAEAIRISIRRKEAKALDAEIAALKKEL